MVSPSPPPVTTTTRYFDFTSGEELSDYVSPAAEDVTAALERYLVECEKYEGMLVPGYWDFPAVQNNNDDDDDNEIPEDLLLPFGAFIAKYNATAAFPSIYASTGLGVGRPAEALTLTAMQSFGAQMARVLLGRQATLVPASGRNQDVYDAIAAHLLSDEEVLYSTTAVSATRTDNDGVTVTVRNSENGALATIRAAKLLIAVPPLPDVLAPFDLDVREAQVFARWKYTHEYAGLVRSRSLVAALNANGSFTSAVNLPLAAEPRNYLETPRVPFMDQFQRVGSPDDDLFHVLLVGDEATFGSGGGDGSGQRDARELVRREFDALMGRDFVTPITNGSGVDADTDADADADLEFVALSDHGPMHLHVSAEDYRAGFVRDLYALQGRRSTWYTGAGFASNFQTVLWAYNEILLPKMLAGGDGGKLGDSDANTDADADVE